MDWIRLETPLGPLGLAEENGAVVRRFLPNAPMPRSTPLLALEGRAEG